MLKYPLQCIFLYKIPYTLLYVVPVAVSCSYCNPDDGYGKYPKHVEWSCNELKIQVYISLDMLCGCAYIENETGNHELKINLIDFSRILKPNSNFI
jgi:hypothetical protein